MKLSDSLAAVGQGFPYYPKLCPVVGGVKACIFVCAIFWKSYQEHDGWVQMSMETITGITGMTEKEQRSARNTLKGLGVLQEKENRLAHQMFYRIDTDALDEHFTASELENEISRSEEIAVPELPKGNSGDCQKVTPCNTRPGKDPEKTVKRFQKPSIEEVLAFCSEIELPASDGEAFFWCKEGNDWKNGSTPIKDWRATIRSWKAAGYHPSQKQSGPRRALAPGVVAGERASDGMEFPPNWNRQQRDDWNAVLADQERNRASDKAKAEAGGH